MGELSELKVIILPLWLTFRLRMRISALFNFKTTLEEAGIIFPSGWQKDGHHKLGGWVD